MCLMRMETGSDSQVCNHSYATHTCMPLLTLILFFAFFFTASVYNMFPIIDLPGSPNDVSIDSRRIPHTVLTLCVCVCVRTCTCRSGTWPAHGMWIQSLTRWKRHSFLRELIVMEAMSPPSGPTLHTPSRTSDGMSISTVPVAAFDG